MAAKSKNRPLSIEEIYRLLESDWSDTIKCEFPFNYNDFVEFVHTYTVGLDQTYPLNNESTSQFKPYIFLLHFSVAYNHFIYDKLSTLLTGNVIHKSLNSRERDPLTDLLILQLWRQKNFALDNLVRSFCIGREFQTFQQLRSYIESCQIIFLLLTDSEALSRFINHKLNPDEYKKLWWKHLSPSKVAKRIKANKQEVLGVENRKRILTMDVRKEELCGNSEFSKKLLGICNDYLHWNKDALFHHSFDKTKLGFRIQGETDWSQQSKANLVNFIEVVSYSTNWIESALSCHVTLFDRHSDKSDLEGLTLKYFHSMFTLRATYNGLYDFSKEQSWTGQN